jgi:hypothetical protein
VADEQTLLSNGPDQHTDILDHDADDLARLARALYRVLCHVLTREAAENMGRPDKAVSPTFFNT